MKQLSLVILLFSISFVATSLSNMNMVITEAIRGSLRDSFDNSRRIFSRDRSQLADGQTLLNAYGQVIGSSDQNIQTKSRHNKGCKSNGKQDNSNPKNVNPNLYAQQQTEKRSLELKKESINNVVSPNSNTPNILIVPQSFQAQANAYVSNLLAPSTGIKENTCPQIVPQNVVPQPIIIQTVVPQPVIKPIAQPKSIAQPIAQPIAQSISQPVVQPVNQPIIAQPIISSPINSTPVVNPVKTLVTNPVAAPVLSPPIPTPQPTSIPSVVSLPQNTGPQTIQVIQNPKSKVSYAPINPSNQVIESATTSTNNQPQWTQGQLKALAMNPMLASYWTSQGTKILQQSNSKKEESNLVVGDKNIVNGIHNVVMGSGNVLGASRDDKNQDNYQFAQ